jgi:hypothetical protein
MRKTKKNKKRSRMKRIKRKSIRGGKQSNDKIPYPIGFSIPREKVVKSIPKKEKILSSLIPGNKKTYIYNTEEDYYNEYKKSYFATTHKKNGWDCMRHYEILANGCIPYFPDIEKCPENTLTHLNKKLIIKGNSVYNRIKDKNINDLSPDEIKECNNLIEENLDHTRNNLTTYKMAEYLLEKSNIKDLASILYIQDGVMEDYMVGLNLHGLKEILGKKCHDYPKLTYVYKSDSIDYSKLYGKGISYTNLLDSSLHDDTLDSTIESDIKNKKYDAVIYGSFHKNGGNTIQYYDLVCSVLEPNKIVLVCGDDVHECIHNQYTSKGHPVFVREQ